MNSRLLQFLNAENITQAQFADSIGVARASISHIISGRNKPSYEFISAMMKRYPQLNAEWLILGKGRMYNDPSRNAAPSVSDAADELLFPSLEDSPSAPEVQTVPSRMNSATFRDGAETPAQKTAPSGSSSGLYGPGTANVQDTPPHSPSAAARPASAEMPGRTKNIVKAIIFFDDGTFQELRG